MKTAMVIDMNQGIGEYGRKFGYIHGEDGGFFFTWMPTLEATLSSVEEDEVDGNGGLNESEVKDFLKSKIAHKFESLAEEHDRACRESEQERADNDAMFDR